MAKYNNFYGYKGDLRPIIELKKRSALDPIHDESKREEIESQLLRIKKGEEKAQKNKTEI